MCAKQFWLLTDVLDIVSEHHLVEDLTTVHADKRVVHLGLSERLEGLDIFLCRAVESWTRDRACW